MKLRLTIYASTLFLFTLACGIPSDHGPAASISLPSAHIETIQQRRDEPAIVRFSGEAYERGLAHGRHFKRDIQEVMNDVLGEHFSNTLVRWYALYHAKNMMANLPEDYVLEMEGIADGAEVSFNNVLLGNLIVDLAQLLGGKVACSSFAVMPERSATGFMITGRNLDWNRAIAGTMQKYVRPMIFASPGKHEVLSIGFPGMVGVLTGINDQNVSMSIMYSSHSDTSKKGYPIAFLYRKVLEQAETFESAKRLFYRTKPRTIASNTMLTDGQSAAILETTSTLAASRTASESGILYSADHFETSAMIGDDEPDRDYRWPALDRWENEEGSMSLADVRNTMIKTGMDDEDFINVKAVFVDYGRNVLGYGHTGQPAAAHQIHEIDLNQIFTKTQQN